MMLSNRYQKGWAKFKKPWYYWVFRPSVIIPTRSCQVYSKQFCLWDLALIIYIASIIQVVWAIWFFVAIVLPELSANLSNPISYVCTDSFYVSSPQLTAMHNHISGTFDCLKYLSCPFNWDNMNLKQIMILAHNRSQVTKLCVVNHRVHSGR